MPDGQVLGLAVGTVCVFMLGGIVIARSENAVWTQKKPYANRRLWEILAAGLLFVALSFPAYLLLPPQGERRTQLLSAIGAGMCLAATVCVLSAFAPRYRSFLAVVLATPIIRVCLKITVSYRNVLTYT
jgi:hypothetical protein